MGICGPKEGGISVERLTQRGKGNDHVYFTSKPKGLLCHENFCSYAYKCEKIRDRKCPYLAVMDRLSDYEDTGLEPQDILSATDMAKVACALHELNQYKELGDLDRLRELVEAERDGRCEIHKVKDGETVYSIFAYVNDLCPKRSNGKPFNPIAQYTVDNFTRNTVDREFGKTVFLSYEAAEAALSDWNGGAV